MHIRYCFIYLLKIFRKMMKQKEITLALMFSLTFLGFTILYFSMKGNGIYFSCEPVLSVPIDYSNMDHNLNNKDDISGNYPKTITFGAKNDSAILLNNVCIHRLQDNTTYLSVYNAWKTYSTILAGFKVHFIATRSMPQDSVMMPNQKAYFMETYGSGNLHHFFNDFTFTLFALVRHFHGLKGVKNR